MCILFPGEPMSDETIDDLMKTIDKDQDGKIGYRGKPFYIINRGKDH